MKYILIVLIFMELSLCSQQSTTLLLHFPSRSSALEPAEKQKLQELLASADTAHFRYKVSIEGHTDNEGSLQYNERLSSDRAAEVKRFFIEAGYPQEDIHTDHFAFNRPVAGNNGPDGKQQNRRVQVTLKPLMGDAGYAMRLPAATMRYTVTAYQESDLKYSSGTVFHIPVEAFVHLDGKPVTGSVQIVYTEYRNAGDFIGSAIPMSWPDQNNEMLQFNSAGMFKIEAYQDEQALKLARNKTIDLDFPRTGDLDNLNLYRFDTANSRWSLANRNTWFAPSFSRPPKRLRNKWENTRVVRLRGRDSCVIPIENAVVMAINTGLHLSQEKDPVYYVRANLYFSRKRIKVSFPAKQIVITGRHKEQLRFKVIFGEDNNTNGLRDFEFVYEGPNKRPFKAEWESASWTDVTMTWLKDDEFWLYLTRNNEKIRLALRALYKGKPLCGTAFTELVAQNKIPNMKLYDESVALKYKKKKKPTSAELRNKALCADSLYCFYDWSRLWMENETGETAMDYKMWLDYFNNHKAEMRTRYQALKQNEPFILEQVRITGALQRANDSINYLTELASMSLRENLETSISINGLGVWNCDQLNRLNNPITVNKTYFDTKGDPLQILCVYVINKAVNGVLTYDGSYNMGPANFKVSGAANNMLLALDTRQRVYMCKQAWFETAVKENSPFLMEALAKEDVVKVIEEFTSE